MESKQELSAGLCTECGANDLGAVCRTCGSALDHHRLITIIEDQRTAIWGQGLQIGKLQKQLHRYRGEEDKRLRNHPLYPVVLRVLQQWAQLCYPEAKELEGGERVKRVLERLQGGRTEDELVRCAFGYSRYPYVISGRRVSAGSPGQRRIDAELIFRDPQHVDAGLAMALEADRRDLPLGPEQVISPNGSSPAAVLAELGLAAIKYAKRFSWWIFPVEPRGKRPVTQHGLLDATLDLERIETFWLSHPLYNVAIRCGLESGLVVLDVDGTDGIASLRALEQRFEPLPRTASVVTPRGGQHYYFAHPGLGEIHNTTGFPGPGLDIRADGGYVLAPPSVGPNGRMYEVDEQAPVAELPGWLLSLLAERQAKLPLFNPNYEDIVAQGVTLGTRNTQLTMLAGHFIAHGHSPDETREVVLAINKAKCAPPLEDREVLLLVQSVVKRERRKSQKAHREIVGLRQTC